MRKNRVKGKILSVTDKPRLIVFRSLNNNYAQLIDSTSGKVLASANDLKSKAKLTKTESAKMVGVELAKKAVEKKIETCVFDRNGYKYHGRIKALADGAREGGLKF
jgi:large subunit ribosomal protein L18